MAALLALALLIGYLALRTRQAPQLPDDRDHATFVNPELCLACHGPDSIYPRSRNHPLGNSCLKCHGSP